MTWAGFYLVCFVVGFSLTLVSLLAGSVHLHIPRFGHVGGHIGGHGGLHRGGAHGKVPVINFATIVVFLGWFGAIGYLLTQVHPVRVIVGFSLATLGGLIGASMVVYVLAKLEQHDGSLDSADYDMVGVLGKLSVPIRQGGTGELVYSLAGTRRCTAARSEDGVAVPKGPEVVVMRYEKGIAYVKLWHELAGEAHQESSAQV